MLLRVHLTAIHDCSFPWTAAHVTHKAEPPVVLAVGQSSQEDECVTCCEQTQLTRHHPWALGKVIDSTQPLRHLALRLVTLIQQFQPHPITGARGCRLPQDIAPVA